MQHTRTVRLPNITAVQALVHNCLHATHAHRQAAIHHSSADRGQGPHSRLASACSSCPAGPSQRALRGRHCLTRQQLPSSACHPDDARAARSHRVFAPKALRPAGPAPQPALLRVLSRRKLACRAGRGRGQTPCLRAWVCRLYGGNHTTLAGAQPTAAYWKAWQGLR